MKCSFPSFDPKNDVIEYEMREGIVSVHVCERGCCSDFHEHGHNEMFCLKCSDFT